MVRTRIILNELGKYGTYDWIRIIEKVLSSGSNNVGEITWYDWTDSEMFFIYYIKCKQTWDLVLKVQVYITIIIVLRVWYQPD